MPCNARVTAIRLDAIGQADEVSKKSENDLNEGDHTVIMPQLRVTDLRIAAKPMRDETHEGCKPMRGRQ